MKYINIMPFKIRFDGEMTNIKNSDPSFIKKGNSHFLRYVKNLDKSNARLSAIFRGRRLSGEKIDLKSRGLSMLVSSINPIAVGSKIDINDEVSNLIYWNYDEEVRPSDDIPQVVNIAQFINIIHSET
ncbi:hypothetical protein FG379_002944 [Cryptosporidium bovis]|uniref:uncharacterized protein n=1 Tax=Cryptosporidium bovis TaxID=310047 RepID=UPI00351A009A|nr:hypothetical protein FG379_002944 [Cryptosporidium bovis]